MTILQNPQKRKNHGSAQGCTKNTWLSQCIWQQPLGFSGWRSHWLTYTASSLQFTLEGNLMILLNFKAILWTQLQQAFPNLIMHVTDHIYWLCNIQLQQKHKSMQLYYLETIKIFLTQVYKQVHVNKYGTVRTLTTMYWYLLHC